MKFAQELIDYIIEHDGDLDTVNILLEIEKIDNEVSNYLVSWIEEFKEAYPHMLDQDKYGIISSHVMHIGFMQRYMIKKFQGSIEPKGN